MKPSASDNPPDAQIRRLSAAGWPIRRIAREVGLSRSRVHEVLSAPQTGDGDPDPWDEGDEAELALDDDTDDPYTEPFTFVGSERTWFTRGQGNGGYWADVERIVNGNGRSVSRLDFWRSNDHDDRERVDAVAADMAAQIEAYERRA
jgi:hypothetical protein